MTAEVPIQTHSEENNTVVSLLQGEDTVSGLMVDDFIEWCDNSPLKVNVTNTKDLCVDSRKKSHPLILTVIIGETVERFQCCH